MTWTSKKIGGTIYDLSHLQSFILSVPRGAGAPYRLRVDFGSHTFTETFYPAKHSPDLRVMDGKTPRAFCLKRYAQSLHLPAAVRQAVSGNVLNHLGRNAVCNRLPGLAGPYIFAFTLRPVKRELPYDCVMTVVSAHHRPDMNEDLPSARFTAVVGATMAGAAIRWKKK